VIFLGKGRINLEISKDVEGVGFEMVREKDGLSSYGRAIL